MKRFAATASPKDSAYMDVAINDQCLSRLAMITIFVVATDDANMPCIGHNA